MFFTQLYEGLRIALNAVRANKLRSILTTLGIVIGIVAVTLMGVVTSGLDRAFQKQLDTLGGDVFFVQKWPWGPVDDWWNVRNRPDINLRQARYMAEHQTSDVTAIAPEVGARGTVKRGAKAAEGVQVAGVTADYDRVSTLDFSSGRFFTAAEASGARPVIVLGSEIAATLFSEFENPIGQTVRLSGRPFTVTGVLTKKGKFLGLFSLDNQVMVPLDASRTIYGDRRGVTIRVRMDPTLSREMAKEELTGLVRRARGLKPGEKDDFFINQQENIAQNVSSIKNTVYAVGLFLAALSLVVGGIGIVSIMFVSVRERTKEIGTRKALGATRANILWQFLLEAVTICLIGGLIALTIVAILALVMKSLDIPAALPIGWVIASLMLSLIVGLLGGIIPAWSAARLDPIEALRYE